MNVRNVSEDAILLAAMQLVSSPKSSLERAGGAVYAPNPSEKIAHAIATVEKGLELHSNDGPDRTGSAEMMP